MKEGRLNQAQNFIDQSIEIKNGLNENIKIDLKVQQRQLLATILERRGSLDSAELVLKNCFPILQNAGIERHIVMTELLNQYAGILLKNRSKNIHLVDSLLSKAVQLNTTSSFEDFPTSKDIFYLDQLLATYKLKANYLQRVNNSKTVKSGKEINEILTFCRSLILNSRGNHTGQNDLVYGQSLYFDIFQQSVDNLIWLYKNTGEQGYLSEALKVVEQTKSSALVPAVKSNKALQFLQIPDSIKTKEAGLRSQLSFLQSELSKFEVNDTSKVAKNIENERFSKTQEYDSLMLFLEKNYPEYYEHKYGVPDLSIEAMQQQLSDKEALIEYFQSDSSLYAFTITKDTFYLSELPKVSDAEIHNYRKSLEPGANEDAAGVYKSFVSNSNQLYNKILAEPLSNLDTTKVDILRIIPAGALNLIPFETFLTAPADLEKINYKNLTYLFKKFDISYGFSIESTLKPSKQKRSVNGKVLSFAPTQYSYYETESDLGSLKWNREEVLNIENSFGGRSFVGLEASESDFKGLTDDFQIIHLATHAEVDNYNPMYSKLYFSPPKDSTQDGMLNAFELYNMRLNSEMTVLSACNTGFGKLESGEGVMSLSRAFAYAGCPSVVMSHWAVEDKTTAELMKYFYEHLAKGEAKDQALRNAKLDFLANSSPLYHHPYYWNNFVVMGDTRPIVKPSRFQWWWIAVAASALLLLFIGIRKRMTPKTQLAA